MKNTLFVYCAAAMSWAFSVGHAQEPTTRQADSPESYVASADESVSPVETSNIDVASLETLRAFKSLTLTPAEQRALRLEYLKAREAWRKAYVDVALAIPRGAGLRFVEGKPYLRDARGNLVAADPTTLAAIAQVRAQVAVLSEIRERLLDTVTREAEAEADANALGKLTGMLAPGETAHSFKGKLFIRNGNALRLPQGEELNAAQEFLAGRKDAERRRIRHLYLQTSPLHFDEPPENSEWRTGKLAAIAPVSFFTAPPKPVDLYAQDMKYARKGVLDSDVPLPMTVSTAKLPKGSPMVATYDDREQIAWCADADYAGFGTFGLASTNTFCLFDSDDDGVADQYNWINYTAYSVDLAIVPSVAKTKANKILASPVSVSPSEETHSGIRYSITLTVLDRKKDGSADLMFNQRMNGHELVGQQWVALKPGKPQLVDLFGTSVKLTLNKDFTTDYQIITAPEGPFRLER